METLSKMKNRAYRYRHHFTQKNELKNVLKLKGANQKKILSKISSLNVKILVIEYQNELLLKSDFMF